MNPPRVTIDAIAPEILAGAAHAAARDASTRGPRRLLTIEAAAVQEKPIAWEWYRRIPQAGLTVIEGDPDVGKTALILDLLARKAAGKPLGDREPTESRRSLIVGAEDALESIVIPRLRAAGADLTNIRLVTGVLDGSEAQADLRLPSDVPLLALELADREILYIDGSINDYAERGVRLGDDIAIRGLVGSVHNLAKDLNKTAIIGRHLRKGGSATALEAGSGPMGVVAKARSVLAVYADPKDPDIRLFARVKCNLAPAVITLRFELYSDHPDSPVRVRWLGEDHRNANEIRAEIQRADRGGERDHSNAAKALVDWLRDGNLKAVSMLKELAGKTPMSWKAFEYARDKLGIETQRVPGGGWAWRDPFFASRKPGGEGD